MPEPFDRPSARGIHLNLDDAWQAATLSLTSVDAREWGPHLRFSAPSRLIESFFAEQDSRLAPFVLYGSGDFHHLTGLWLRRVRDPVVLVSFDNHPDWDVRPPRWACGGWINRALELPQVDKVAIWGCGNFECWWPAQMFGNRRAEAAEKIELHIWADDRPLAKRNRRGAMLRTNWRERFEEFVRQVAAKNLYITIDLDCLTSTDAVTNWESGKFAVADLEWALEQLHAAARVIGGDICGAYSEPKYARAKQRFVAEFDHPKLPKPAIERAREINQRAIEKLWRALTQGHQNQTGRDQQRTNP